MFRKTVLVILLCLLLFSCSGKPANVAISKPMLTIKSSYMNTPFFLAGTVLEGIINYNTKLLSVNESVKSNGNEKIKALMDGSADLAILAGPEGYMAFNGHPNYWSAPQNIRALFGIFPSVYTGFTHIENIKSISDLIGYRVAINTGASVSGDLLLYFLKLNGINTANTTILRVEQSEGERLFSEGFVDFIWYNMSYKYSFARNVSPGVPIRQYNVSPFTFKEKDKLREFLSVYPVFYTESMVDMSENADAELEEKTFVSSTFIACSENMDDETAYIVTKAWFENIDYIKIFFPSYNEKTAQVYFQRRVPVPFHPGAIRYFKETGFLN
ncbi:MAG: TAXI family TRAP transporter solute-binding subunit [Spirochaetia bacterium]|nr:TAXI family TRAP transporter solute-binding subunit [Spirochaetia bacterium]